MFVLLIDLYTKSLAEAYLKEGEVRLLPFLSLVLVYNRGIAFGLFADAPESVRVVLLIFIPLIAVGLTFFYTLREKQHLVAILMGIVAGGALGNLYDRFFLGKVRDFIYLSYGNLSWPAFNLADASVSLAILLFLLKGLLR
ncbi:MAG: signal peptidase II [Aquificota bacterium]|nr:MAG: signal peptidase II [Aquificota bacterium]